MNVSVLIVEQVEYDGCLRSFWMWAEFGRALVVGLPNENESRGLFYFLEESDEKKFEKGFAQCRAQQLPKSRFAVVDGEGVFKSYCAGIPTERHSLSLYALLLPEFAIPTMIEFKDPHSNRQYSKWVVRDDMRNRFVTYLPCRSSRGSFDFSLHVTFRNDRASFRDEKYEDDHMATYGTQFDSYEDLLAPDLLVQLNQFFMQKTVLSGGTPGALSPQMMLPVPTGSGLASGGNESRMRPASTAVQRTPVRKLPPKKLDLSEYIEHPKANLTERQREVASLRYEYELSVPKIEELLGINRKTIYEHLDAAQRKMGYIPIGEQPGKRRKGKHTNPIGDESPESSENLE